MLVIAYHLIFPIYFPKWLLESKAEILDDKQWLKSILFIPKMIKLLVILFLIKWLNSKINPCRRIETLSEKKPFLHNKFWSIYCEVLSGVWPNFAVVKYNSKILNIYHQIKFRKRLMNRFSIKKLFLQIPQHSQKNTGVGVSF